jgi:hypothetical protein
MSFRETRRECLLPPTIDEVIEAMLSIDAPTAESLNPKPRPKPQPKPLGPVNEIDWEAEEKVREQREKAEM